MRLITTAGFVLVLLALPAIAGDFEDGLKSYNNKDYSKAIESFMKAAEQGHVGAQSRLGFMYYAGQGVTQDDQQAMIWYRKAAEQGDAEAQEELGFLYIAGRGVAHDHQQAMFWYHKAAEQGHAEAQAELGLMYLTGQGVTQDYAESHKWLSIAGESGSHIGRAKREHVEKRMTSSQIAEAQRRANEWRKAHSKK